LPRVEFDFRVGRRSGSVLDAARKPAPSASGLLQRTRSAAVAIEATLKDRAEETLS
jgi:hypothetical protein